MVLLSARADRYTPPYSRIGPPHLDIDEAGTSTAYLPFGRRDWVALSTAGAWPIYTDVVLLSSAAPEEPEEPITLEPPPNHVLPGRLSWERLSARHHRSRLPWANAVRHDRLAAVHWQRAEQRADVARLPWAMRPSREAAAHLPFKATRPEGDTAALPWRSRKARNVGADLPWGALAANDADAALPWITLRAVDLPPVDLPWEHSQRPSHENWPSAALYDAAEDDGDIDWRSSPSFAELAVTAAPVVPIRSADLELEPSAFAGSAAIDFGVSLPLLSAAGRLHYWHESADCDYVPGDTSADIRWGAFAPLTSSGPLVMGATAQLSAGGDVSVPTFEVRRLIARAWLRAGAGIGLRLGGQLAPPVRLRLSNPPAIVVRRPPPATASGAIDIPRLSGTGPPLWRDGISALPWGVGTPVDRLRHLPWGPGSPKQRDTGTGWESEPPEPDPSIITVPLLRVYNVSNAITVVRLPERTPIHPLAVSASLDDESWAWRVQMTLFSESEAALLTPAATPKEVEVTINGWIIIAAIESYSRDRRYPQQTWTVTGRSRQAYLAEPYQRPRSHVSTGLASAEQLAGDELPSGWTLDWEIPDWTVPAGAWSYDQLTPIQAISRIATAAGAVAQPDPQAKTITVRSRYPASPDDWATATLYASINEGLCTRMGAEYRSNPERNAVIVTGGTQGVLVNATRFGTAGDDPLDTITEALCTAVEAGQERARVELDSTGNAIEQSIAIPVIDPLGIVPPGVLVEVMEDGSAWRGLVRSTSIAVARTDRGISVGQTLGIERRV